MLGEESAIGGNVILGQAEGQSNTWGALLLRTVTFRRGCASSNGSVVTYLGVPKTCLQEMMVLPILVEKTRRCFWGV